METVWLESLLALLEHGSFTLAAEAQHISQPTFSRRIRALERWAGAEIVDRSTYPAALTPAGVRLRALAIETVAEVAAARDEIRGRQLRPREAVRVSLSHTLATHFFARWWKDVSGGSGTGYVPCILSPLNTFEAYDSLLHGDTDLLLAYADPSYPVGIDSSEVQWRTVARDRLAPYSRLVDGAPRFSLPGAKDEPVPFVTYGQDAFLGRVTDRIRENRSAFLQPVAQSSLSAAVGELVRAGAGVGWLPGLLTRDLGVGNDIAVAGGPEWTSDLEVRLYSGPHTQRNRLAHLVWERVVDVTA